ncbi:MAG: DsbA family protein [Acidimicrobiales bacterium]
MTTTAFAVTWDYRCPFARNAHEHLAAALEDGAPWEVTFVPYSLSQVHVPEDGTPVWDDPAKARDLVAMESALVVRDRFADRFLGVHRAFFTARHDEGRDLREREVVADILSSAGVPADEVLEEVAGGGPRSTFRAAHEEAVTRYQVFGVPTFVVDGQAVFVRLMTRPAGDAALARRTIDRVLSLLEDAPELNEFKHTSLSR